MSEKSVNEFIDVAIQLGGWMSLDREYLKNRIKTLIGQWSQNEDEIITEEVKKTSIELLAELLEIAENNQKISPSDDIKREELKEELMEILTPPPSVVNALFSQYYDTSPEEATDYYYSLNSQNGFIQLDELDDKKIDINQSSLTIQPKFQVVNYDNTCQQCFGSEGAGLKKNRIKRMIRMNLKGDSWGFYYEPTQLIPEQAIFSSEKHEPFEMNRASQELMLRLLDVYPHYFVSYDPFKNQTKDHGFFYGGKAELPLFEAEDDYQFDIPGFVTVNASFVDWPLSVIRLKTTSKKNLLNSIEYLTLRWQQYSYPSQNILANDENSQSKHSIVPLFRQNQTEFIAELILLDSSDVFNRSVDYENMLFDKQTIVDQLGVINVKSDLAINERLTEIIKTNFEKQQIFKQTPDGETARIRFINTL